MGDLRCPFCGHDPYHYVDNGVGMEAVAVNCCDYGVALFRDGDELLSAAHCAIEALRAQVETLAGALAKWAIMADYDCAGDTPELAGYFCDICEQGAGTAEEIAHEPDCLLASMRDTDR